MADNTSSAYPAGWYADMNAPGTERYYDGTSWTAHTRPAVAAPTVPAPSNGTGTASPAVKQAWYRRKGIIIPVGVVAGLIVVGAVGGALGGSKRDATPAAGSSATAVAPATEEAVEISVPDTIGLTAKEAQALIENAGLEVGFSAASGVVIDRDNWTVLSTTPSAGAAAKSGSKVIVNVEKKAKNAAAPSASAAPTTPEKPSMTTAQSSAVRSAKSYLSFAGFSRVGLTTQLTSEYGEGYAPEDAEFAIAYLESSGAVDWNAEAQQSAESYLKMQGFSHDGLYDQLTSEYGEQFTPDQANFALAAVGL